MIKKYCDVCKKEVPFVEEYSLPESEEHFATDGYGNQLARVFVYRPHKKDLCPTCAAILNNFINNYLHIASDKDYGLKVKIVIEKADRE